MRYNQHHQHLPLHRISGYVLLCLLLAVPCQGSLARHRRRTQTANAPDDNELNIHECGQVIATVPTQELRDMLDDLVVNDLDLSVPELLLVQAGILPEVDYGVQVIKVCGKCSDYAGLYKGVCEPDDYAFDSTHSGLLLLPLVRDTTRLVRGTRPLTILSHGTTPSNMRVPSNLWNVSDPDGLVLFGTLFTGMTGCVSLLPDFTGYGESRVDAFRAYVVRKAYVTGTLPLIWESEALVANISDCKTAVADDIVVVGYSEGKFVARAFRTLSMQYKYKMDACI